MVMTLLQRMHQQQIEADAISYTSALSAGSISGRFENGGERVDFFCSSRDSKTSRPLPNDNRLERLTPPKNDEKICDIISGGKFHCL